MKLSEPNLERIEQPQQQKPDSLCKNMKCCPINNTLNLIGKKFTLLLLRNMMMLKQTRFNQFMGSIEEINPKTLSIRLKEMEKDGLIKRKVFHEIPVRVEYVLTEKAMALTPILEQMAIFSMRYCTKDVFRGPPPKNVENLYSNIITKYRTAAQSS
ncbi:MAG TPA: helix-turn-helix domain-containing protein [Nitrososphaeraceae archaeon]